MKTSHKHLLAFAISIIYIVAVYFLIGIYFSTNDDRFMGELMSGAITGNIESHLVYVNYLLSLPLSLLYRITTGISWFGILLVLFHWFSCYCILDSFYSKAKSKTDICISTVLAGLLFLTELYLISQISYTMTASFMAVAGYVCLILNENKKSRIGYFIVLELLAFLLRDKAMLMIQPLGFAVFFGLVLIGKNKTVKAKLLQVVKIVVILAAVVILGFAGNKIGYHSEAWQAYMKYNDARTTLFDYSEFPPYEEVAHILEKYDVSKIDYNAYVDYTILDWELSLDCVKELAEYIEKKQASPTLNSVLNDFKTATFEENYWQTNTLLIFGFICVVLFLLLSKNFAGFLPLIFLTLARTVIWLYLLYEGRFPLRIAMPLFACELVILVALAFYFYCNNQPYAKWQNIAFVLVGAILGVVGLWSAKIQFVNFRQMNTSHAIYMQGFDEVMDYCNENSENRYILDTLNFIWYNGEALNGTIYGERNCISAGSWLSGAPTLLEGNRNYLDNTENGFYYIMLSEEESTEEELNHPSVLYLADVSKSTPYVADSFVASHGGTYSVIYFDGELNLKRNQ